MCEQKRQWMESSSRNFHPLGASSFIRLDRIAALKSWLCIFNLLRSFADRPLPLPVEQEPGTAIFVPTGWYHQVIRRFQLQIERERERCRVRILSRLTRDNRSSTCRTASRSITTGSTAATSSRSDEALCFSVFLCFSFSAVPLLSRFAFSPNST